MSFQVLPVCDLINCAILIPFFIGVQYLVLLLAFRLSLPLALTSRYTDFFLVSLPLLAYPLSRSTIVDSRCTLSPPPSTDWWICFCVFLLSSHVTHLSFDSLEPRLTVVFPYSAAHAFLPLFSALTFLSLRSAFRRDFFKPWDFSPFFSRLANWQLVGATFANSHADRSSSLIMSNDGPGVR